MEYPNAARELYELIRKAWPDTGARYLGITQRTNLFLIRHDIRSGRAREGFWQLFMLLINDFLKRAEQEHYEKIKPGIIEILESVCRLYSGEEVIAQFKRYYQIVDHELVKEALEELLEFLQDKYSINSRRENPSNFLRIA